LKEEYLINVVNEKITNGNEDTVTEFKVNNNDPEMIGSYISALSNSATLADKDYAYVIWGVEDEKKSIVGTNFNPDNSKVGNEELLSWLSRAINPSLHFSFHNIQIDEQNLTILRIPKATHQPIAFKSTEYIRVGSYKKKLKDFPDKEKQLWKKFQYLPFELQTAVYVENYNDIFELLNYSSYFNLLNQPVPDNEHLIIENFIKDDLIKEEDGKISITNLGALLFAKNLNDFKHLRRKAPRVIKYKGNSKVETLHEQIGGKGYATGFEGLIKYINSQLPRNEVIGEALRKEVPMYPELAVRELVANALIHQDFTVGGTGPVIEIFDNRVEIVNPGTPLIKVERLLDSPPKSRNELLASLLRRMGICEERGTGIDKVVAQTEAYQLPAPAIDLYDEHVKVTLLSYKDLNDMSKDEKIHATYMHACLKYVEKINISNQTLRNRFGLDDKQNSVASRIIKDSIDAGVIKPVDPETSPRHMKYIPYWA